MAEHTAAESRSSDSSLTEAPSPYAELQIKLGPVQGDWGSAEGHVPSGEAHHLVTTFGILGSAFVGAGGAVLTLSISHTFTWLALAELALALVAAVLIAAAGRSDAPTRRNRKHPSPVVGEEQTMPGRRSS